MWCLSRHRDGLGSSPDGVATIWATHEEVSLPLSYEDIGSLHDCQLSSIGRASRGRRLKGKDKVDWAEGSCGRKWTKVKEDQSGRWQCTNQWHLKELSGPPIWVQQVYILCEPKDINRKPIHLKGSGPKIKPMDTFWVWEVQTCRHFQGRKSLLFTSQNTEGVPGPGIYITGSDSFQIALDNLKALPDDSIFTSSLAYGHWVDDPTKDHLGSNSQT